jgi:hypothetical protein
MGCGEDGDAERTSTGETIIATRRERVIGINAPRRTYSAQLAELIAEQLVLPPAVPGGSEALLSMPEPVGQAEDSASDLDQIRADRL